MQQASQATIVAQSATPEGFLLQVRKDSQGLLNVPGLDLTLISIHLGMPSEMSCRRQDQWFRGTAVHGDLDIIPAETPSLWQMHDENDTSILLGLPQEKLRSAANDLELDSARLEVRSRFQIRDRELESIGGAIRRELELNFPSGRLCLDGLTTALASRLVTCHSSLAQPSSTQRDGLQLGGYRLKRVLSFIEENLDDKLSIARLGAVAGLASTHLKVSFRNATGLPVHQYVIQRRVERAKALLRSDHLSMAEVALQAGFSHQSHMARHMQRVMGVSPLAMKRLLNEASEEATNVSEVAN